MTARTVLLSAVLVAAQFDARADDPTVRAYGALRVRTSVDTRFDSDPGEPFEENVFELYPRVLAGLDAQLSQRYRLVLEARGRSRFVEQRAGKGQTFLLANGRRQKAEFEVEPWEAYLDLYTSRIDLRVGRQIFAWGANLAYAPADNLNPVDLRSSNVFGDPAESKLPVFAVSARAELGPLTATAAFVPFFEPSRYVVFGQDDALLQPAMASAAPDLSRLVDPSMEGRLQPFLMETERPSALPTNGDLGLRVSSAALGPKLGLSYLVTREKLPRVKLDPVLSRLVGQVAAGQLPDESSVRALFDRLSKGAKLSEGTFPRYHIAALEASDLFGPLQVDLDCSFSPSRTFYTIAAAPVFKPAATVVVGVSDARATDLIAAVTWVSLFIPGVDKGDRLLLIDSEGAEKATHTAALHAVLGTLGTKLLGGDLSLEVRGGMDVSGRSFAVGPRIGYRFSDQIDAGLGAEVFSGPALSPFGYFRRNDNVFGDLRVGF
jgi:hypothetical protein